MHFIGRARLREQIRDLLVPVPSAPHLVHVQGMAGIGKTALLRQLADELEPAGYRVVHVDPRLSPTERSLRLRTHLRSTPQPTLVVVDDWHQLALDEAALIERLAGAEGPVVLLLASRVRPGDLLRSPLFPDRATVVELAGLDEQETLALLASRGVAPGHARAIHRTCHGHPFAALLLADVPEVGSWAGAPGAGLAEHVALQLVEHVMRGEDPFLRTALELAALAGTVNEHELREVLELDAPRARALFDRLRTLTVVQTTPGGLELHPIVREAVLADRLVRDPPGTRALVGRLLAAIGACLGWEGTPRTRALRQLSELIAVAPQDLALTNMFRLDGIVVAQGRLADLPEALDVLEAWEGAAGRAIAERWVRHDPQVLTVSRTDGVVTGVMIRAELRGPDVPEALEEPALRALVETLRARGALPDALLLRVTRFFVSREAGELPSAELGVLGGAMTRRTLDTTEPFLTAQIFSREAMSAWGPAVRTLGFEVLEEAAVDIDGRSQLACVAGSTDLGHSFAGIARRAWGLGLPVPARPEPWEVAADGSWARSPGGERVDLSRRHAARRILAALARSRIEQPGTPLSPAACIEAGWPDERMAWPSAKARLWTAIRTLRAAGLEEALETAADGYRLGSHVRIEAG